MHLRHAAQRVRVLHARIVVAMRLADLAVGEQLAQQRADSLPGRAARARPECARRTRPACPAAPRATSRRRRAPRARAAAHHERASAAIAVCACVPLMSVIPSFGPARPARDRSRAACPRRRPRVSAPEAGRPRRSARARDARAARGRRSRRRFPAPGIGGYSPAFSMPASRSTSTARAPEYPLAMTFARSSIIARTSRSRQQRPDAGRVAAHEIDLQLGEPVRRDRDVGQLAEPGRHAVDNLISLHDPRYDRI